VLVKSDCGQPRLESGLLLPHRLETSCFSAIFFCIKAN
jgi:hypothetical protein